MLSILSANAVLVVFASIRYCLFNGIFFIYSFISSIILVISFIFSGISLILILDIAAKLGSIVGTAGLAVIFVNDVSEIKLASC